MSSPSCWAQRGRRLAGSQPHDRPPWRGSIRDVAPARSPGGPYLERRASCSPTPLWVTRCRLGETEGASAGSLRSTESQAMLLDQSRHAVRVDLELVFCADHGPLLGVCGPGADELADLREVLLEAGGRDQLAEPSGLVTGVPEGMPLAARLEDEVAWVREDDLVAELRAHPSLEDVAVLVLIRMAMHGRGQRSRLERMLNERELTPGLLPVDHEADAEPPEVDGVPIVGSDDLRPVRHGLEGDVPVLALRSLDAFGLQGAERADQLGARLVGLDHVVDVAALGRRVGVGEVGLVVVDQLRSPLVRCRR